MRKVIISIISLLSVAFATQAQPAFKGPVDTAFFHSCDFEWHVTPRHDYSQTLVGKLFLSQAHYDERFKLRDNGEQTVYMNCEEALEAVRAMDAITMGLNKVIYLVGWQYNGHDSKYPAFFECNEAIRKPGDDDARKSIIDLMDEARKYHTSVSVHVNMFNCYDDSPLFEKYKQDDVLARYADGSYIHSDWGWTVSYARDWATGNAQARLDRLCELLPIEKAGTIHIDAFHSSIPVPVVEGDEVVIRFFSPISPYHGLTKEDEVEAQLNIISYLDSKGIDVTTEGYSDDAFSGYVPATWHSGGKNLFLTRTRDQLSYTNSGYMGDVFGRHVNTEEVFRGGEETMGEKVEAFKRGFCMRSIPFLYLGRHRPIAYISSRDGDDAEAIFSDGIVTHYVEEGDSFSMYRDGVKLADGGDIFVPVSWVGDNVVVAYSRDGYEGMEWTLPSEIKAGTHARAYVVDADGSRYMGKLRVRGRKVMLSLSANQMLKLEF